MIDVYIVCVEVQLRQKTRECSGTDSTVLKAKYREYASTPGAGQKGQSVPCVSVQRQQARI